MDVKQLPQFIQHLQALYSSGMRKIKNKRDGGSCNHDTVYLAFKRKPHPSTLKKFEDALLLAGFSSYWMDWVKGLGLGFKGTGQGLTNTIICEHVANGLKQLGWDVRVDYRLD